MADKFRDAAGLDAAIEKLTNDLEWRGPSGAQMGNIVLPRALAEIVLTKLKQA